MPRLTCRELIEFLDEYVAGELAAAQREHFDDHLARCPSCVRYVRGYQGTLRAVAQAFAPESAPPAEVPEQLVSAILAARKERLRD